MRLASIDLGSNALTVTILEQKYGKYVTDPEI